MTDRPRWLVLTAMGLCLTCAEAPFPVDPSLTPQDQLAAPMLHIIGPATWAAGDVVTILGSGFATPPFGRTVLTLRGAFTPNTAAPVTPVDLTLPAAIRNGGQLELVFEPTEALGFVPGHLSGELTAVNIAGEQRSDVSAALPVSIDIGPSIIVWELTPERTTCASGTRVLKTVSGTTLAARVETTGLLPASPTQPLSLTTTYVDAQDELRSETVQITSGSAATIDIDPGELPLGVAGKTVLVNFRAADAHGGSMERSWPINLGLSRHVVYNGHVRAAELLAPTVVSGCIPGGPFGRAVGYGEDVSESRERSVTFSSGAELSLWVVSAGFGVDVSESVGSDHGSGLSMDGYVLPNQFGVFYRQTTRLEREGHVMVRDACGSEHVIGRAIVTDWTWAPDLAVTRNGSCPPLPASNLPTAQLLP